MIKSQEDRLTRIYGADNVRQGKRGLTSLTNITITLNDGSEILCNPTGFEVFQDGKWYSVYIDTSGRYHLK